MSYQEFPSDRAEAITPSDTVDLPVGVTRAIYVGGAGNIAVIMGNQTNPVTFMAVPVGQVLPIRVRRVLAVGSGTTATNLLALY